MAFTWKLWFPGFTAFPRVPLLSMADGAALIAAHYVAAVALVSAMIALAFGVVKYRWCAIAIAVALLILFIGNQHCLQPWAWQAFIIATLFACLPVEKAKMWIARVLISIFLFSAIGKFDYQFIHSLGQEFLEVILGWLGLSDVISAETKANLVLLFPIGELLVAVGLMFKKTRKLSACLAIALHVALMLVLSPLGLGHRWPVVIWNGLSILLVVWLFLLTQRNVDLERETPSVVGRLAVVFAIIILAGPMLRPMQLWDHWLAWGLYSPSNSRVEVFVPETSVDQFDQALAPYLVAETEQYGRVELLLDRWSLDELGAPIYPQARFQKAAAITWLRANELLDSARVIEYGQSHPLTGDRPRKSVSLPAQ